MKKISSLNQLWLRFFGCFFFLFCHFSTIVTPHETVNYNVSAFQFLTAIIPADTSSTLLPPPTSKSLFCLRPPLLKSVKGKTGFLPVILTRDNTKKNSVKLATASLLAVQTLSKKGEVQPGKLISDTIIRPHPVSNHCRHFHKLNKTLQIQGCFKTNSD